MRQNGTVIATGREDGTKFITGGIMVTDPVCGMKVDEKRSEFETQFAGRKYSFCSENCKKEFEADPDEFVETVAA
jgi:Cu+-exporting ATPase